MGNNQSKLVISELDSSPSNTGDEVTSQEATDVAEGPSSTSTLNEGGNDKKLLKREDKFRSIVTNAINAIVRCNLFIILACIYA